MTEVFVDTFYFIAMLGPDGEERRRAQRVGAVQAGKMVTTAWVLTEVASFLRRPHERQACVDLLDTIATSEDVERIPADARLWTRGVELYGDRLDKEWSLTDCISFVVMAGRGISDALTADHHFEQAGSRRY